MALVRAVSAHLQGVSGVVAIETPEPRGWWA